METIINYIGLVIGLILPIIGIILQIKSIKHKELCWAADSTTLFLRNWKSSMEGKARKFDREQNSILEQW